MKLIYLLTILFINTCLSLEPPHYDYFFASLNYKTNFQSNLNSKITKDFKFTNSNIFNSEIMLSYYCKGYYRTLIIYEFLNHSDNKSYIINDIKYNFKSLSKNDFIKIRRDIFFGSFGFMKTFGIGLTGGIGYNPFNEYEFNNSKDYSTLNENLKINKLNHNPINYKFELNLLFGSTINLIDDNSYIPKEKHFLSIFVGLDLEYVHNPIIYNNLNYNFNISVEYSFGKENIPFCPQYKYCDPDNY